MSKKNFIRGDCEWNEELKSFENYDETLPVRKCTSNIAKMNVFEYIYFDFKYWNRHEIWVDIIKDSVKDFIRGLFVMLTIPLAPIGLFFIAHSDIKRCKKEVKIFERNKRGA